MAQINHSVFKSDFFKKFTIYGVGQFFNLVTPLLVVPYIVSVCTEEGYGKIGVGLAISFFLMVFIDYGSDILGVKEVAVNRNNPEKLETLFTTIYTAKLFLLLIVLAVTCLLIFFVPYFNQEKRLFFFGLPVLVGQFINPTWFLQGMENFKWITFSNIFSKVVYVAGIFWCIHEPSDYVYNNLFWGIGMILANSIAFIYLWKQYGFSFKKTQKSHITSYLKSNFSMFGSQIFVSLQMYFPIVLVSYFGNNTMAGQYKIIDQIIVIFRTYILLFFNFIFPRVCYLLETSKAEALQFWRKANGLNFGFTLLLLLLISGYSFEIVDYFNPLNVAHISNLLQIALLIPLLQSIGQPLKQLVLGWNKQKMYTHTTMFVTVITLLLIVLLTPSLDVLGVLTALIISEILVIAVFLYAVKNKLFNSTS
ncbi:oligosaccharide flippase family protein [Flavobacterium sp.]|uniref:oligosaccharide flippase family protein n=1 Tax=Flavobacterium sp. TaxID=239 RepID=UPI002FDDBBCA